MELLVNKNNDIKLDTNQVLYAKLFTWTSNLVLIWILMSDGLDLNPTCLFPHKHTHTLIM